MAKGKTGEWLRRTRPVWVWLLRILLGGVFIASGLSKSIDLWGTVYKIEEYLRLWDFMQPRMIVVTGALLLCGGEFVLGCMLFLGCYRRSSVMLLTLLMAAMLPLTLWLWIADPVADCGCFGDMIVLSNAESFWKNVVITAGLICLWRSNKEVTGVISPYGQWLAATVVAAYVTIVALIGFNIQPLYDFRRFPEGTSLLPAAEEESEEEADEATYAFIYERNGERREFSQDNLPDSTWTFIDRRLIEGSERATDGFAILDDGEDITGDVISADGEQMLVVIPEILRVNPSHTFAINTLSRYMTERGGNLTALIAPDSRGLDYWMDISMAGYPVYTAEPTLLKELVRGNQGVVFLRDGKIVWKRTLTSMELADFEGTDRADALIDNEPPGPGFLGRLTLAALIILGFVIMADRTGTLIHFVWLRRKKDNTPKPNPQPKEND